MSFVNLTDFATLDVPCLASDGREVVLVVVKGTFRITDEGPVLAGEQAPVRTVDEVYDPEAEQSSVRLPGDVVLTKPGADVVVVGSARSAVPVTSMMVGVALSDRAVQLRIWGERLFYRGAGGRLVVGEATAFTEKPVTYERARGGTSADYAVVERRNPVGRGVAASDEELVDTLAPQIEDPALPVTAASDRHPPVGFGAIAMHWSPRCEYMGTLDARWEQERMPLMPLDFDPRHFLCAHPSLQLSRPLVAGEAIRVEGMRVAGPLAFEIPPMPLSITGCFDDGERAEQQPGLDTLVIDADAETFEVTCRAAFPLGRGKRRLRAVRVAQA